MARAVHVERVSAQPWSGGEIAWGTASTWAGQVEVTALNGRVRSVRLPRWKEGGEPSIHVMSQITVTPGVNTPTNDVVRQALREVAAYLAGDLQTFTVALDPVGTPFQQRVWAEVERVPWGETRSYSEISRAVGAPDAVRAVGAANGANRVAPIVPCHRIVGSDGRLTGYGPGLPLKLLLLRMEGALPSGPADYDAWVERVRARAPGKALYLGVRRANAYCLPSCERARAASDLPARFFTSPLEAELASFAPCHRCHPAQAKAV
jgi:methylated-DNA-[protein]-cysteine S-methyltransferase